LFGNLNFQTKTKSRPFE